MNTSIKLIMSFFMCFLLSSAVLAQDQNQADQYGNWDANQDSQVDRDEFSSGFDNNTYYNEWDANDDNMLDENEWNEGFTATYRDYETEEGMFDDWDANDDDFIDNNEYSNGMFDLWDEDDNELIDNDEYNTWNDRE